MLMKLEDLTARFNALNNNRRDTIARLTAIEGAIHEVALLVKTETKAVADEKAEAKSEKSKKRKT